MIGDLPAIWDIFTRVNSCADEFYDVSSKFTPFYVYPLFRCIYDSSFWLSGGTTDLKFIV